MSDPMRESIDRGDFDGLDGGSVPYREATPEDLRAAQNSEFAAVREQVPGPLPDDNPKMQRLKWEPATDHDSAKCGNCGHARFWHERYKSAEVCIRSIHAPPQTLDDICPCADFVEGTAREPEPLVAGHTPAEAATRARALLVCAIGFLVVAGIAVVAHFARSGR